MERAALWPGVPKRDLFLWHFYEMFFLSSRFCENAKSLSFKTQYNLAQKFKKQGVGYQLFNSILFLSPLTNLLLKIFIIIFHIENILPFDFF
jgi:hypothetical protein